MSLIFSRELNGPQTHALVIGVGNYPFAKPGKGVRPVLGGVPDLPSAADSAKLVCDWFIENQDRLSPPLASVEVLISDPISMAPRYQWRHGPNNAPDPATALNIDVYGFAWYKRVIAQPGGTAFFYCCGHGASHLQQPVLFIEDLNQDARNPWAHINLGALAYALGKDRNIGQAALFSDACGEYVKEFELEKSKECLFYDAPNIFETTRNHVSLLCAAAEAQLAYEGTSTPSGGPMLGRFTQTFLQGLSGSSARQTRHGWGVNCRDLAGDLKSIRRVFFSHWGDNEPFEPYPAVTQTDRIPLVFPQGFELPVVVMTDPLDKMPEYDFFISQKDNPAPPWLKNRAAGDPNAWYTTVPPSLNALYAIAAAKGSHYPMMFQPKEPLFDHWVPVP